MNVLIFSHSSEFGGAERSLLTLVDELITAYKTRVTVVLPSDGPSIELLQNAGATILTAPINLWCTVAKRPDRKEIVTLQNQSFDWIIEHLNELFSLKPDLIVTNTIVIPWGSVAAALLNRPHIWMINEFGELDHGFNFFMPFDQVLNFIEKSSDIIVTRSNAVRDTLFPNLSQDKIRTIYRSIDLPEVSSSHIDRSGYVFQHNTSCHLLVVGTIRKSKGQQDAVRALIELVNNRKRQVELVMVGHAEDRFRDDLEQMAKVNGVDKNICILPFQENINYIMDQADIVLVCSRMEAAGRVILESMLLGKPIIGTNTGGTPEMIREGETGLLYEPGNIAQLVNQIEKLIDNPKLMQKIAENGAKFARTTFTKEKFAGEFHKLFVSSTQKGYQSKHEFFGYLLDLFLNLNFQNNSKIEELKEQNNILEQEVLTYAMSKSWVLTRPIRKLKQLIAGK